MKTTSSILLSTVLGLATAQNFSGQPACATPCLTSAISVAGCALSDQGCQCGTGKAAIGLAVATCLISACNPTDLAIAATVGNELCVQYSMTAPSATATGSMSMSMSTASTGGVLTIQTSTGPTTTATTSLAMTTGTSVSGGVSAGTTSHATTSHATTSHASSSGSSAAAASTSKAGAAGVVAGAGGMVGLVLGLVAAL